MWIILSSSILFPLIGLLFMDEEVSFLYYFCAFIIISGFLGAVFLNFFRRPYEKIGSMVLIKIR